MKAIAPDDPIFGSENGALKFAFNYVHGGVKVWTIGSLGGGGKIGKGLSGLDGAGQAGLIRAELGKLDPKVRLDILVARYAHPSIPCPCKSVCCRGYRENPEWAKAIETISEFILTQGVTGTVSHFRLRREMVSRYFGVRSPFVEVAKQCGINRDTASDLYHRVSELLKKEEQLAKFKAEEVMKAAGMIE